MTLERHRDEMGRARFEPALTYQGTGNICGLLDYHSEYEITSAFV